MNNFVRGLFTDLQIKIDKMTAFLNGLTMTQKAASAFKKETVKLLNDARGEILAIFNGGLLNSPLHTRNVIIIYKLLEDQVVDIELDRYLAIRYYDERADGYFGQLIERIYIEIGSLQTVPFVSTFSNSETYYWAETGSGMIALPHGEERNLLNLSDLYHEIGHFLFEQYSLDFGGNLSEIVDQYYDDVKQKILPNADEVIHRWKTSWIEEFSCDLIGTFLSGAAYAWSNFKICASSSGSNKLFGKKELAVHPANEARMRGICIVLRLMGLDKELKEVEPAWKEFISRMNNERPPLYDELYPQEFLETLAKDVLAACTNIGLNSYTAQLNKFRNPASLAINQAWHCLRSTPEAFREMEVNKIKELGYEG